MARPTADDAPHGGLTPPRAFALRFFLFLAAASVLSWAVTLPERLGPAQRGLATAAAWLAGLTGGRASVNADEISVGALLVHINFECTGVYVLLILFVFLLAYPARWRQRLLGAAIGLVALQILNVLRIAFLVRVAELRPGLFDSMHEYVWQGLFLVLTVAYAMTWVEHSQ
ncbi:archaeosortase/exosortase family protein [bacterium]|nr:archaeosortase/exosortase family protein [bacterium]